MIGGDLKVMVESCSDMPEELQEFTLQCVVHYVKQKVTDNKELADTLLLRLETAHGPGWNCAIGRDFGSSMSYQKGSLLFAYVGKVAVLVFKSP